MKRIGLKDTYGIYLRSVVNGEDKKHLVDFYLPIIGAYSLATYLLLIELSSSNKTSVGEHYSLLAKLNMNQGEFANSLEPLEASGLVRTYLKKGDNHQEVVYLLFAPLTPKAFLEDPLFRPLLTKNIGEEALAQLEHKYKSPLPKLDDYQEVTASFASVFSLDLNDPAYTHLFTSNAIDKNAGKAPISFDIDEFNKVLKEAYINPDTLSEEEIDHIEKLSALYKYSPVTMAELTAKSYSYAKRNGEKVDFRMLEKACSDYLKLPSLKKEEEKSSISSNTMIVEKIKMLDSMTPIEFLTLLQRGHKPSPADQKIVNSLSTDIGLNNGPINALVDYILETYDNVLSADLAKKIGASMIRADIKTAQDAMDYLKRTKRNSQKQPLKQKEKPREEEEVVTDEEIAELLSQLN